MQILGTFESQIASFYYTELIALVAQAVAQGDFAGGFTFNQAALDALIASDISFASLTLPTAGTRTIDEDFNFPLTSLQARINATASEITNFNDQLAILLEVLNKDTELLDQLLYAAKFNNYLANLPVVSGAIVFNWNFGVGFGKVGTNLLQTDPTTGVIYTANALTGKVFNPSLNINTYGLLPGEASSIYAPIDLTWDYTDIGFFESATGLNWAELDFLQDNILLTYSAPQIEVQLPNNVTTGPFAVMGNSITQGIPIFVQTIFIPRMSTISVSSGNNTVSSATLFPIFPGDQVNVSAEVLAETGTNGSCSLFLQYLDVDGNPVVNTVNSPILTLVGSLTSAGPITNLVTTSIQTNIAFCQLTLVSTGVTTGAFTLASQATVNTPIRLTNGYTINPNTVSVFSDTTFYNINVDFVATGNGFITTINIPDETNITISFSENFPSYRCSVNQINWSPVIMFDSTRPYPDNETEFLPIPIGVDANGVRNKLPIVDEAGLPTGLFIALTGLMKSQYLLMVYQDADSINPGQQAQLVIDFGQPVYMNTLNLTSYTNFPVNITSIDSQAFTTNSTTNLYSGNYLLENPTSIQFPTTLVSLITLSLTQQNYTIKQHQILPDDYLRREAINDLQAIVPSSGQITNILPSVVFVNGYQYELGIENISGENAVASLPTVFISGPYAVQGVSSTLTLQANFIGNIDFYLCYESFNGDEELVDSNVLGIAITPGSSAPFPYTSGVTTSSIDHTDLYLKIIFRSANSCLSAFSMQVD